jgi:hypothetical protein
MYVTVEGCIELIMAIIAIVGMIVEFFVQTAMTEYKLKSVMSGLEKKQDIGLHDERWESTLQRISALEKSDKTDHETLIRIDANVQEIMKRLDLMERRDHD